MCKVIEDMRKEGREEGLKEGMRTAALRMLEAGKYTLEEIVSISGLPLEELERLQAGQTM